MSVSLLFVNPPNLSYSSQNACRYWNIGNRIVLQICPWNFILEKTWISPGWFCNLDFYPIFSRNQEPIFEMQMFLTRKEGEGRGGRGEEIFEHWAYEKSWVSSPQLLVSKMSLYLCIYLYVRFFFLTSGWYY